MMIFNVPNLAYQSLVLVLSHYLNIIVKQAIAKVRAALNGYKGRRMADLEMMVQFTHTGDLGNYFYICFCQDFNA